MPRILLLPQRRTLDAAPGERLIDALRRAGVPIARSCGDSLVCGRCAVRVRPLAGGARRAAIARESEVERRVKRRNRVGAELRLACALRVRADLAISAPYWGELP